MDPRTDKINRPDCGKTLRIAVIGAGISGLAAARMLLDHGHDVTCFDKGRGVGGRTSVRRSDRFEFDMGAPYFIARQQSFKQHVDCWVERGIVAEWKGCFVKFTESGQVPTEGAQRWVGQPGMTALAKHLAESMRVELATNVARIVREPDHQWHLSTHDVAALGHFDRLVVSLPAPQAKLLLWAYPELSDMIKPAEMQPCWTVLLGFEKRLHLPYDGATAENSPLASIARNNSKPGRSSGEAWVLHASPLWSIQHLEDPAESVAENLLAEFQRLTSEKSKPAYIHAHRWRYALASKPLQARDVWCADLGISLCGDWCGGSTMEDAFLSGLDAAAHVLSA